MLRGFLKRIGNLLSGRKVDESLFAELEEALILADVSAATTATLTERLQQTARRQAIIDAAELKDVLRQQVVEILGEPPSLTLPNDTDSCVWLILGVNGTGKTTSVGKLAYWARHHGARPLLAAADTFRAAAIEQLQMWGQRADVPVIAQRLGADPAAVTYDALQAAKARHRNLVIVDTAGRLHTKHNLMEELRKIARVVQRESGAPPAASLLVLDATTGQNGLMQAHSFTTAVPLTGIVLTKLDGTAKGGIVLTIRDQLPLPITFVGVGEKIDDLELFDARAFAQSLFSEEGSA